MRLTRRKALGLLGAGATLAACKRGWQDPADEETSRALCKAYVPGAEGYATREERWFRSTCGECSAGCGIRVRVVEGRAVRIEGDAANPVNQGGIGVRGISGLHGLYDADRLQGPMVRDGGALVPISWDGALDRLAGYLKDLRARGVPEKLLVWSGLERGFVYELLARFARVFGTPNFVDGRPGPNGALFRASQLAFDRAEHPVFDWAHADLVLSLEAGLVEDSCQSVYFTRMASMRRAAAHRARLVHVGPMFDLCAHDADDWIQIHPGTSGAVALGVARLLLAGGASLPADRVTNVDAFETLISTFTPDAVAAISGIDPARLGRLADQLKEQGPAIVVVDSRSLAYSNGVDTALAAFALDAVLGGRGVRNAPVAPLRAWDEPTLDAIATAGLARPRLDGAAAFGAHAVHETLPDADPPEVLLLHHANPAYARQQPARWAELLAKIPHVVSFSPFLDETVDRFAELVLPESTYLERWEAVIPAPGADRAIVSMRAPVVTPLYDTRATGDVVLDLAGRAGLPLGPWRNQREAIEARLAGLFDAQRGSVVAANLHDFLSDLHDAGAWVDEEPGPDDATPDRVNLPTSYSPPTWFGDAGAYPLALVAYRPLGYAEGSGANLPWTKTMRPHPGALPWSFHARVHPDSAPGISDGDTIRIESPYGAITCAVAIDDGVDPGMIALPLGGGHTAFGRWATDYGANAQELLRPGPTAYGNDLLCGTRVRIVRGES